MLGVPLRSHPPYFPEGPALPGPVSALGLNLPEFIATTSLGHIIGAGAILGLGYIGALA